MGPISFGSFMLECLPARPADGRDSWAAGNRAVRAIWEMGRSGGGWLAAFASPRCMTYGLIKYIINKGGLLDGAPPVTWVRRVGNRQPKNASRRTSSVLTTMCSLGPR